MINFFITKKNENFNFDTKKINLEFKEKLNEIRDQINNISKTYLNMQDFLYLVNLCQFDLIKGVKMFQT